MKTDFNNISSDYRSFIRRTIDSKDRAKYSPLQSDEYRQSNGKSKETQKEPLSKKVSFAPKFFENNLDTFDFWRITSLLLLKSTEKP